MRTARRLAITLAIPLLLLLAGDRVTLPGIPADMVERAGAARDSFGVFALGITPILSAYWIVELVALLVPRWAKLRHGDPAGRVRLERAAVILALVLAAVQAASLATVLQTADVDTGLALGRLSSPLIIASLMGGVCVQLLAARFLSRHGLINGLVALWGAGTVRGLGSSFATHWRDSVGAPREHLVNVLALVTAAVVSAVALRGAGSASGRARIPLPSSSAQAYIAGSSILVLATSFGPLGPLGDSANLALLVAITGLVMVIFAYLLHRGEDRAALHATLLPSFLFLVTLILAARAAAGGVLWMVILTPIAMDLLHALRVARAERRFVPVWEERRASAVPVLRAALAAEGIATEVDGMAVLSFWQVFAPYAPAQILVKDDDRERALRTLQGIVMGDAPLAPGEAAPTFARRTLALGACVLAAGAVLVLSRLPEPAPPGAPVARAELAVVRVDDTVDAFASLADADLPPDQGIGIYPENASVGPGRTVTTHYARIVFRPGETSAAALARVQPWLSTIALPKEARFGFEPVEQVEDTTQKVTRVGLRTFVLSGPSMLGTDDVTAAAAVVHPDALEDMYVGITLSPDAARRFEDLTREWTKRRLAILIDGEINSAPLIMTAISGGHVSITTAGSGDVEQRIEGAKRLARALGGR